MLGVRASSVVASDQVCVNGSDQESESKQYGGGEVIRCGSRDPCKSKASHRKAPVKDADGNAPLADTTALELCAVALKRWRSVHNYCETRGRFTDKGEVK